MADPAAVFPAAGLNIAYQFTPTHYIPQAVNVPSGAGALWAQAGQTALEAGKQIMQSPLNPAVRAQMQAQAAGAQGELDFIQRAGQTNPDGTFKYPWMRSMIGYSNGQMYVKPLSEAPQVFWGMNPPPGGGGGGGGEGGGGGGGGSGGGGGQRASQVARTSYYQGEVPPPQAPGGVPSPETLANLPTGPVATGKALTPAQLKATAPKPQAAPPQTGPSVPSTGQTEGGIVGAGQLSDEQIQARIAQATSNPAYLSASAAGGAPVPPAPVDQGAGGTIQPGPPRAAIGYNPIVGRSVFGSPGVVQPPAPDQFSPPMLPPSQQPVGVAQATQTYPTALATWQNQNVHPVIAPAQVLQAVKANVTTKAQHATYLPNGGVNGEPAYAIDMAGGGQTVLSASQIASSPWGRSLMIEHNASESLEQQNQGQSGQPPAQPGGQPQPQLPQQPPAQAPQPPGQLPQDEFNRRVAAATLTPSAGGPPIQSLTAQAAPGAAPRALPVRDPQTGEIMVQQPNSPLDNGVAGAGHGDDRVNITGTDNSVPETGLSSEQLATIFDKVSRSGPDPNSETAPNGDHAVWTNPDTGVKYWWDSKADSGRGAAYLYAGETPAVEFRRYFPGDHIVEIPKSEGQLRAQAVKPVSEGGLGLDWSTVQGMSKGDLVALQRDAFMKSRTTPIDDGSLARLDNLRSQIVYAQRLERATQPGGALSDPAMYTWLAQRKNQISEANIAQQAKDLGFGEVGDLIKNWASGPQQDALSQAQQNLATLKYFATQSRNLSPQEQKALAEEMGDMSATNRTFPQRIHNYAQNRMADYNRLVEAAGGQNKRLPNEYIDTANAITRSLKNGQPASLPDPGADWRPGKPFPINNPPQSPPPSAAAAASRFPPGEASNPIRVSSQQDFDKLKSGDWFLDSDNRPKQKK